MFPDAIPGPIAERPGHVPHLRGGVQPSLRDILGWVGEDLRITGGHVRGGRHLHALGNEVVTDDFAWRYTREAGAEGSPDPKSFLNA